ncbi:MAG: magnesium chelatase subunit ChlI family protein, partial [bacterium]
ETVRARVAAARDIQFRRAGKANMRLPANEVKKYCSLKSDEKNLLIAASERMGISARGIHRILKVARTIADLNASESIERNHLSEALSYRLPEAGMSEQS